MTVIPCMLSLVLFLLIFPAYGQKDCMWCASPVNAAYPISAQTIPNVQRRPHHLEYSFIGDEPMQPNYFSFVIEETYPPLTVHHQSPTRYAPRKHQRRVIDPDHSSFNNHHYSQSTQEPAFHLDYFMNLDQYDIHLPDVSADSSWEPIDDFFLSVLDRYTRFWRRYRNGTEVEEPSEEEVAVDGDVEKSDKILKNIDEKFKTIDRLFDENQPSKLKLRESIDGLEKII